LSGKPDLKRPIGKPGGEWKDNIEKIFMEQEDDVNFIELGEITGSCEQDNEPSSDIKCRKFLASR
jgi:hypothetical protein